MRHVVIAVVTLGFVAASAAAANFDVNATEQWRDDAAVGVSAHDSCTAALAATPVVGAFDPATSDWPVTAIQLLADGGDCSGAAVQVALEAPDGTVLAILEPPPIDGAGTTVELDTPLPTRSIGSISVLIDGSAVPGVTTDWLAIAGAALEEAEAAAAAGGQHQTSLLAELELTREQAERASEDILVLRDAFQQAAARLDAGSVQYERRTVLQRRRAVAQRGLEQCQAELAALVAAGDGDEPAAGPLRACIERMQDTIDVPLPPLPPQTLEELRQAVTDANQAFQSATGRRKAIEADLQGQQEILGRARALLARVDGVLAETRAAYAATEAGVTAGRDDGELQVLTERTQQLAQDVVDLAERLTSS